VLRYCYFVTITSCHTHTHTHTQLFHLIGICYLQIYYYTCIIFRVRWLLKQIVLTWYLHAGVVKTSSRMVLWFVTHFVSCQFVVFPVLNWLCEWSDSHPILHPLDRKCMGLQIRPWYSGVQNSLLCLSGANCMLYITVKTI